MSQVKVIVADIQDKFNAIANPVKAISMSAYMRDQFVFLGIPTPERQSVLQNYKRYPFTQEGLVDTVHALWQCSEREYRYAALYLLLDHIKLCDADMIPNLLAITRDHAWWDTVDGMSSVINRVIRRFPTAQVQMDDALTHESFWTRRTAMIHQLGWKGNTDEQRLFLYAINLADEKEFFIRKAIGWALRDYARYQPERVKSFVLSERERLSSLTVREALKRITDEY